MIMNLILSDYQQLALMSYEQEEGKQGGDAAVAHTSLWSVWWFE